jgi:aspartyl-tRNA(Asn)/glutamyl-tRNA(Gln) amidotransferase subunit A
MSERSPEPADLPAVDLLEAYRQHRLSPVETMKSVLARVRRGEPRLAALWRLDEDRALAEARVSEARWMRNAPDGALDGVPVTIKENIATHGDPVPLGTAASDLTPAARDAPPAARLREAGAIIFAKTTMPDYGMLSSSLSSFHALSRNPWALDKTPGGSSSGAGAAAAAGYGPLHIGTDIGGSVRLPAGWCGIVGLKPSLGRIPIDPPFPGRVAGPMTRTVADAALMLPVLAQPDARDHMSLPPGDTDWRIADMPLRGLRLGLMMDAGFGLTPQPDVAEAVTAAARVFEAQGAIVTPLPPILKPGMIEGLDRFWRARAWSDMRTLPHETRAKILPFIRAWAEAAQTYSGEDVYSGFARSLDIRKAAHDASQSVDFILSPTAPVTAFDATLPCPTKDPKNPFAHIAFTVAFNMSEQPALSINCGYSRDGLPIGLQIAGRRFDDVGVLRLAAAYERLRPPQRSWPVF